MSLHASAIVPKFLSECGHCLRQAVASLLIVSLACSGTPQTIRRDWNDAIAQEDTKYLGANTAEYEVYEIPPSAPGLQPVHVDPEEFKRTVARLARGMPLSGDPRGVAQFLFGVEREVEFLAQMQGERLVLLQPLRERRLPGSPAEVALTRQYQDYCSQTGGGGDCLLLNDALARGKSWLARRWEAQARGRWVEGVVKQQFQRLLQWNQKGVDAIDPKGYSYEILSGTHKNMAQHGRRMSDVLFRMITF